MKHYLVTFELVTETSNRVFVQSEELREVIQADSKKDAYIKIKGKYLSVKIGVDISWIKLTLVSPEILTQIN